MTSMVMMVSLYGLLMGLVGFSIMGYDKKQAVKGGRRVPERTLFLIALIGGAAGVWFGMSFFRHKTKHVSFQVGVPLLLLMNAYVFIEIMKRGM